MFSEKVFKGEWLSWWVPSPILPAWDTDITAGALAAILRAYEKKDHTILLNHEEERNNAIAATEMELEIIILSELSQKEKDKYHMISLICGM